MLRLILTLLSLVLLSQAVQDRLDIVLTNKDGWADSSIREMFYALQVQGFNALISAPAVDHFGVASETIHKVVDGCQYQSCPPNSTGIGQNATMSRFHYVNSDPSTAMRYGIEKFSPMHFPGKPHLAIAGVNHGLAWGVGAVLNSAVPAASIAAKLGVPAIAFHGATGEKSPWTAFPAPAYARHYSKLAADLVNELANHTPPNQPLLPRATFLNVNFNAYNQWTCNKWLQYTFILTRVHSSLFSAPDLEICENDGRLATESSVVHDPRCYVSVSVVDAWTMTDAGKKRQAVVYEKLKNIMRCPPEILYGET